MLFSFPSDTYLEVELLDHMVVLFLIFLRKLNTVFHSDCANLHSHQHSLSLFSSSFSMLIISHVFDDSHSNRYEVISHCDFGLHFPDD